MFIGGLLKLLMLLIILRPSIHLDMYAMQLHETEMRMLRWMVGIKRIENIRREVTRARAGVANISEKIREVRLRWLGHVERKTEEDVVMRRWKWWTP